MRHFNILLLLLLTVTATVQGQKKVTGNGNVVTLEREVGSFDAVATHGWFDVILIAGKEGEISIEGEENLLPFLITTVKRGTLIIETEKGKSLKSSSGLGITISIPITAISAASLAGTGSLQSKTNLESPNFKVSLAGSGKMLLPIETTNMEVALAGSGNMTLSGKTEDIAVSIAGSGIIEGFDLTADSIDANLTGSGTVKITANTAITAKIAGSGEVIYKGNADKIKSSVIGSGGISSY
ncbi:MAG: head GIN domain-containing protein [Bacteroidota bacterium]